MQSVAVLPRDRPIGIDAVRNRAYVRVCEDPAPPYGAGQVFGRCYDRDRQIAKSSPFYGLHPPGTVVLSGERVSAKLGALPTP